MHATQAQSTPITDTERQRRRRAHRILKEELTKATGLRATLICMAISHARRELHCRSYGLYHGGWRDYGAASKKMQSLKDDPTYDWTTYDRYLACFGEDHHAAEARNFGAAVITSLNDQAEFLVKYLDDDDRRAALLWKLEAEDREIYPWQRPRFEPQIRTIIRRIVDTVPVS
jgi:hypothetical protein